MHESARIENAAQLATISKEADEKVQGSYRIDNAAQLSKISKANVAIKRPLFHQTSSPDEGNRYNIKRRKHEPFNDLTEIDIGGFEDFFDEPIHFDVPVDNNSEFGLSGNEINFTDIEEVILKNNLFI